MVSLSRNNPNQIEMAILSAGVGRTGCFLAISIGIKQLDSHRFVDIVKIVCQLRMERGGMVVQTLEQYAFIYEVLAYYCVYFQKCQISNNVNVIRSNCSLSPSPHSNSSMFSFNTQR